MFAIVGPNEGSIAIQSISLENLLLNIKNDSLVATLIKLRKNPLGVVGAFSSSLYKLAIQMSMVLSSGMLVNKQSIYRAPI